MYEELGLFLTVEDAEQHMRSFSRIDVLNGKIPENAAFGDSSVCKFYQRGKTIAFKIKALTLFNNL
jgi:hypothetical protein